MPRPTALLVGQSGGPTAAINSSLLGVVETALGRPEMAKADNEARLDAHEEEAAALRGIMRGRTADEWEAFLQARHVPAARVRTTAEAMAGWRRALGKVAALQHVTLKVSGIGLPGRAWTAQLNRPVVEGAVEAFGVDRVMFASNFPVDSLTATYAEVYGGFLDLTAGWSPEEQSAVFARTAVRTYRLPSALLAGALRREDHPASGTGASPRS